MVRCESCGSSCVLDGLAQEEDASERARSDVGVDTFVSASKSPEDQSVCCNVSTDFEEEIVIKNTFLQVVKREPGRPRACSVPLCWRPVPVHQMFEETVWMESCGPILQRVVEHSVVCLVDVTAWECWQETQFEGCVSAWRWQEIEFKWCVSALGRWQETESEGCASAWRRRQKSEFEGCVSEFGRWQEAESESLRVGMGTLVGD